MKQIKDLVGQTFGHLKVLEYSSPSKWRGNHHWKCICECGNISYPLTNALNSGDTKSCGCTNIKRFTKHKMFGTRFYRIWQGMKTRCENPKQRGYQNYGGRGIEFNSKWNNFVNFRDDMYESYLKHYKEFGEKETSIDRLDNNGNYCKENCRWATKKEQQRNTRKNLWITFGGKSETLTDWSKKIGMNKQTLHSRISKGWSNERALTQQIQ